MRTALIIGAGALAVYLLTRPSALASPAIPVASGASWAGQIWGAAGAPKPPASIATPNTNPISLSGVNALENAGCSAVASSKGVPAGLASTGCKLYSLFTPLGEATKAVQLIEKIPYVGGAVKAVGGKISGAASSVYHDLTSIF